MEKKIEIEDVKEKKDTFLKQKPSVALVILLSVFVSGIMVLTYNKYTVRPIVEKMDTKVYCVDVDKLITDSMKEYIEKHKKINVEQTQLFASIVRDELNKFDGDIVIAKNVVLKGCEDITDNFLGLVRDRFYKEVK